LLITLALKSIGVAGIWYATSGAGGALAGNCLATALALRMSGLRWSAFARPGVEHTKSKLLQGSLWMFVLTIGLPLGLQSHRLILSHVSTPGELSRYALMAQIFAVVWMVFDTAGMALWPVFVKRRSNRVASTQLWLRSVMAFGVLSAVAGLGIVALGPWATSVLSGGQVGATRALAVAFAVLLFVECIHLPGGIMLTMPREARDHEHRVALDGGPDGLDVQRRVVAGAPDWLRAGGHVLVETGRTQLPGTEAALRAAGFAVTFRVDDETGGVVARGSASEGDGLERASATT